MITHMRFNIMLWFWIIASLYTADAAEDENLKHPDNCRMYYSVIICPIGEHFDSHIGDCLPKELADCKITNTETTIPPISPSGEAVLFFPYPNSCEKYYHINICDENFNFNPATNACDYPRSKGCPPTSVSGCKKFESLPGMDINSVICTSQDSNIGDECRFQCPRPLQAMGTILWTCTESGWKSEGPYVTPTCVDSVVLIQAFIEDMFEEIGYKDAGILFVMDESGSVTARNFEKEKMFIQGVIGSLPLSASRSAGVILFSDKVRLEVSPDTENTCNFFKQVADMKYKGGGTDIRLALETAKNELENITFLKKVVVLLTDGQSPNATEVAEKLKKDGATIFTIGVTGYDAKALGAMASLNDYGNKTLFYAISDPNAMSSIVTYLKSEYIDNITSACELEANNGLIGRFRRPVK